MVIMKRLILVLLMLQIGLAANAQKHFKLKKGFYIGLNTTNVIKNLLSFTGSKLDDPYTISGFLHKKNTTFRIGLGLDYSNKNRDRFSFADNTHSKVDLRIGFQKTKPLWKNLYYMYGFDLLGGYETDKSRRGEFYNDDLILSGGAGPILGVIYKINDKVLISTESSLYFRYSYKQTVYKNGRGTDEEIEKDENLSLVHLLPNSLYFYIRL